MALLFLGPATKRQISDLPYAVAVFTRYVALEPVEMSSAKRLKSLSKGGTLLFARPSGDFTCVTREQKIYPFMTYSGANM